MAGLFDEIRFVGSFPRYDQFTGNGRPEFAFIGRSNVGKSSLINMLTGVKNLAKTSSTPGKTLMLNFFACADSCFLVDLPGYGYAKVSKAERSRINKLIQEYFLRSSSLKCVFLLVDLRIERQESDKFYMEWFAEKGIPFVIVFTKSDKLSKVQVQKNKEVYLNQMQQEWEELPQYFISSSQRKKGKEELTGFMVSLLQGE